MSLQTVVVIIMLILLLVIVVTFVGSQLGDMFGGLGEFGSGATGELPDPSTLT